MQTLDRFRHVLSFSARVVDYLHEAKAKHNRKRDLSSGSHLQTPDHGHWQDNDKHIYAQIDYTTGQDTFYAGSADTGYKEVPILGKRSATQKSQEDVPDPIRYGESHCCICGVAKGFV